MLTVIFDMDGLMLDTERVARVAWRRAMAEQGYNLDDGTYLLLVGHTDDDVEGILQAIYGEDIPVHEILTLSRQYDAQILLEDGVPIRPGLFELLDFLKLNAVPCAVASSTAHIRVMQKLKGAGILAYFQAVVCGDEVAHGKPAPDVFLEAARQMNARPQDCVALEDSEAGIRAAYSAGMLPVMVPDLKQPSADLILLAYRILPSLHEVIPLVRSFLREGLPQPEE